MAKNVSPWVHQLDKARVQKKLSADIESDVAIIGAGIAGTASAFFTLKYTDKRVVLIERFKLAHGATGHNAGQVVSYFERGFASMVDEYGQKLAAAGQEAVDGAWELLDEMYTDSQLDIPLSRFVGHAGLTTYEQVLWHLENNYEKRRAGLHVSKVLLADSSLIGNEIPAVYEGLYEVVTHKKVLELVETKTPEYVAVVSAQKGCVNSALFCQEVIGYLQRTYPERFALYEHTSVHKILLRSAQAILDADTHTVTVQQVVLCTNGFESIHIFNETGLDIDAKYHHLVNGKIGYMSGYLEKMNKQPTAISYYSDPIVGIENSYFYLTRRPYEYEKGTEHNLISIGGPDIDLTENLPYSYEDEYPDEMGEKIDLFVKKTYDVDPNKKIDYIFTWHGLMGYTTSGIRLIGPEPQNPVLLYNLGCNGIGILPSIYGGRKISRHLSGEDVEQSIFDIPAKTEDTGARLDDLHASAAITKKIQ